MKKIVFLMLMNSFVLLYAVEIRVAYYSGSMDDVNKQDLMIATDLWIQEIAKEMGHTSKSTVYEDIGEMLADMEKNKIDFVVASGLIFVEHFDLSKLSNGFMEGFSDGSKEHFVIVVQKKSNMKSTDELQNKRVAIQKNDKLIKLYIENEIMQKDEKSEVAFETYPTRQRALLKLFFNKVDAAVVTNKSLALFMELNPQIKKKIKVLDATSLNATSFGFIRKSLDDEIRHFMNEEAKSLHKDTRGRQLLTLYKTEVIVDSKLDDLKPIMDLYQETQKLKNRKNK